MASGNSSSHSQATLTCISFRRSLEITLRVAIAFFETNTIKRYLYFEPLRMMKAYWPGPFALMARAHVGAFRWPGSIGRTFHEMVDDF